MTLKYANTQAFSASQDNDMVSKQYKFLSYKYACLLKNLEPCATHQTPTNLMTGGVIATRNKVRH